MICNLSNERETLFVSREYTDAAYTLSRSTYIYSMWLHPPLNPRLPPEILLSVANDAFHISCICGGLRVINRRVLWISGVDADHKKDEGDNKMKGEKNENIL